MFLKSCQTASGAEAVRVLVTGRASHKGHRYAVARVKPYQGQRTGSRRPKNWEFLRAILEDGVPGFPTEVTQTAEADDLFGRYSRELGFENVVILTQDKDMRMVPGWHMDWKERLLTLVTPDTWALEFNDKLFGRKWFWMQMLHGDTADNIPGLPKYINPNGKPALCGEKTAEKLLAECTCEAEARAVVFGLYRGYYEDSWHTALIEQAVLLWMRNDSKSSALNVMQSGNPLYLGTTTDTGWAAAMDNIKMRIAEAQV